MAGRNKIQRGDLGWRVTPIRTAIINILSAAKHPLSVQDILSKLPERSLSANKTTVYRDLALFLKQGLIRPVEFGDDKTRYELTTKGHHHHLICSQCKKIQDIVLEEELAGAVRNILKKKNFKVLTHSLEFHGLCASCQK